MKMLAFVSYLFACRRCNYVRSSPWEEEREGKGREGKERRNELSDTRSLRLLQKI